VNFAYGQCFNCRNLFDTFPVKKLATREKYLKINHRCKYKDFTVRVFLYTVKLIMLDIINNGITFRFPTTHYCCWYMKRICGEEFKRIRRNGGCVGVDYIATNFTDYNLTIKTVHNERIIERKVYMCGWMRDIVLNKINNEGFLYNKATEKTVKDYLPEVCDRFPDIPKPDIDRIIKFGWRAIYRYSGYRADIAIKDDAVNHFSCYIGKFYYDGLKYFNYYVRKYITKTRIIYKRDKTPFDGYYYFALTE